MIRACAAESYVQLSHYGEFMCETSPPEILYKLTPFPFASLKPDHTRTVAERLPRCRNCRGFLNKFCLFDESGYRCCLCGAQNPMPDRNIIDSFRGPEFQHEVYDAFCMGGRGFLQREHFVRTDVFVISLNLLRQKPFILDALLNSCGVHTENRQMALVVLHGAVSVLRLRPRVELMTFCDGVEGAPRYSAFFGAPGGFCECVRQCRENIMNLKYVSGVSQHTEGLKFAFAAASVFGSNVHLLFDDDCFHLFAGETELRNKGLNLLRAQTQVSLVVFIDDVLYRNPLFDLVSITGGYLRMYPRNCPEAEVFNNIRDYMRVFMYHDTLIYVKPPENGNIVEFAGKGMQVTNCDFVTGKIEVGSTFYFSVSTKNVSSQYIQFAILFTTEVSVRKFRIITLHVKAQPSQNLSVMSDAMAAIVAQRLLAETEESAKSKWEALHRAFKGVEESTFGKVDGLFAPMSCGELVRKCLTYRSGSYSTSLSDPTDKTTGAHHPLEI